MRKVVAVSGLLLLLMTLMVGRARATLFDRGNGLVFDSVNGLSWTQNAALSGLNDWAGQKAFGDTVVVAGFDDLILATLKDLEDLYRQLPGPNGSNKTGAQGPFINIQSTYWSLTEIDAARAPIFSFLGGDEAPGDKNFQRYGWAYRFGDSQRLGGAAPVPIPATAVLLGMGLLGLGLAGWWRARVTGAAAGRARSDFWSSSRS